MEIVNLSSSSNWIDIVCLECTIVLNWKNNSRQTHVKSRRRQVGVVHFFPLSFNLPPIALLLIVVFFLSKIGIVTLIDNIIVIYQITNLKFLSNWKAVTFLCKFSLSLFVNNLFFPRNQVKIPVEIYQALIIRCQPDQSVIIIIWFSKLSEVSFPEISVSFRIDLGLSTADFISVPSICKGF